MIFPPIFFKFCGKVRWRGGGRFQTWYLSDASRRAHHELSLQLHFHRRLSLLPLSKYIAFNSNTSSNSKISFPFELSSLQQCAGPGPFPLGQWLKIVLPLKISEAIFLLISPIASWKYFYSIHPKHLFVLQYDLWDNKLITCYCNKNMKVCNDFPSFIPKNKRSL